MGQKKQREIMQWIFIFSIGVCLLWLAMIPNRMVYAATEPTYELTEETKEVEAYIGTVVDTSSLNVRTGFGSDFDKVKVNGSTVILSKGDKVAIMSSGKSSGGSTWYEVRWVKNGTEYQNTDRRRKRRIPSELPIQSQQSRLQNDRGGGQR